jgi:hypothetical protein
VIQAVNGKVKIYSENFSDRARRKSMAGQTPRNLLKEPGNPPLNAVGDLPQAIDRATANSSAGGSKKPPRRRRLGFKKQSI